MRVAAALLSLAVLAAAIPSNGSGKQRCCDVKCYKRMEYADSHDMGNASKDCKSYQQSTITPCATTKTVQATTTVTVTATASPKDSEKFRVVARHNNDPEPKCTPTVRKNEQPKYANGYCSGSDFGQACSCLGFPSKTVTARQPTSTVTDRKTITKTVTVSKSSTTKASTTPSTAKATTTKSTTASTTPSTTPITTPSTTTTKSTTASTTTTPVVTIITTPVLTTPSTTPSIITTPVITTPAITTTITTTSSSTTAPVPLSTFCLQVASDTPNFGGQFFGSDGQPGNIFIYSPTDRGVGFALGPTGELLRANTNLPIVVNLRTNTQTSQPDPDLPTIFLNQDSGGRSEFAFEVICAPAISGVPFTCSATVSYGGVTRTQNVFSVGQDTVGYFQLTPDYFTTPVVLVAVSCA